MLEMTKQAQSIRMMCPAPQLFRSLLGTRTAVFLSPHSIVHIDYVFIHQ